MTVLSETANRKKVYRLDPFVIVLNQVLFEDKSHKSLVIAKRERRIREGELERRCRLVLSKRFGELRCNDDREIPCNNKISEFSLSETI